MPKRKRVNLDQLTAGELRDTTMPYVREDATARMRERDEREAQDTRTILQELLGEPMPCLSALTKLEPPKPKRMPTEEDVHAAMVFARIVSARLERIARVSRTRVRLRRDD
jgi:hypothetical protein